jgi:hypothetical protein
MNKKAIEGLKKESDIKDEMNDIKKSIRHLEIELDYMESSDPNNYKYIRNLEGKIDELYEKWEDLDESN